MKDIVITAGTAIGSVLALAEAITQKVGCKAYVLCTDKKTSRIIASSRFVHDVVYIKAEREQDYIIEIQNWYEKTDFQENPILYFTGDTSCFYIDNHRNWFQSNFELCLPSSEIIQTFTQKGLAEIKADEAGLVVPKTRVIKNNDDIKFILLEFKFPIILKPRATYLKEGLNFKINVIQDKNEFLEFTTKHIEENSTLLCQEFIPGGNDTSYYYLFYRSKIGDIFENSGRKTLQSSPDGGVMLKGLSEYNKELSVICKIFLNTMDYQGIGGIEFKKYNGQFYFIEMSVRLEGFFKISEISNTSLALLSYYDLSKLNIPNQLSKVKQKNGYIYIDFFPAFIYYIRSKSFLSALADILNIVFNPKVKINVFSFKSCKPFFNQFIKLLK